MNRRFIVLEGIDGAGTTTQAERLSQRLRLEGHQVVTTREPSVGPVGKLIRLALEHKISAGDGAPTSFDWATLALLFAADRRDHVRQCIEPALDSGVCVICDRYDLSSYVYQSLTAPDPLQGLAWVQSLNNQVRRPDITVVLDVSPSTAEKRRSHRGTAAELFEQSELQVRLAAAYQEAHRYVPNDRLIHVNGELAIDEVTEQLWRVCTG